MAATYNRELGVWQLDGRGAYDSKEAAELAQGSGASTATRGPDVLEFDMGGIQAPAPDAPGTSPTDPGNLPNPSNPGGISDNELQRRTAALSRSGTRNANINRQVDPNASQAGGTTQPGNIGGATGAYNSTSDAGRATYDYMHELGSPSAIRSPRGLVNDIGERAGVSHAGDVANPLQSFQPFVSPESMFQSQYDRTVDPNTGLGQTIAGNDGNAGRPVARQAVQAGANHATALTGGTESAAPGPSGNREGPAAARASDAEGEFRDENAENQAENAQAWGKAWNAIEGVKGGDYALSDEARGYQREGLRQQRQLLEHLMGFDPNQYATQFADQALARQVALGRSQGTSAAAQQAGTFAAMEQAPSLYAEGARQASTLENQRLGAAETAAKSFGELGTMTRGQDEARAQFESNLGLSIANSVGDLTKGQVQLNQQESQMFAEMWTDFAQLQSVYAGMDSDEQIAWWQNEATRRGQDKQLEAILANLKAGGSISSKDLVAGLFQLGGGVIGAGGSILAAKAGKN
jgi:hypothetical protein